ncbi:MAG: band 7 protein, partial [Planctomycetales bacterium]
MRKVGILLGSLGLLGLIGVVSYVFVEWTVNRVYVEPGHSLLLRYKGPLFNPLASRINAKPGHYAQEGEIGIRQQMRGPGRHFYCPIWWDREIVGDVIVKPGEVAIITSKLGGNLPTGQFLVDGELGETKHKGILRRAYTAGRYRINPYGYSVRTVQLVKEDKGGQIKNSGWVSIDTGYVGVVTNLTDNPITKAQPGIQDTVLPPGLYPINTKEQQIDIVEIGYREATISIEKLHAPDGSIKVDEAGEPVISATSNGINFTSSD